MAEPGVRPGTGSVRAEQEKPLPYSHLPPIRKAISDPASASETPPASTNAFAAESYRPTTFSVCTGVVFDAEDEEAARTVGESANGFPKPLLTAIVAFVWECFLVIERFRLEIVLAKQIEQRFFGPIFERSWDHETRSVGPNVSRVSVPAAQTGRNG
jgi:hypothetical protein